MNLFLILYYFFIGLLARKFFEVGQIFQGIAFIACGIALAYLVEKLRYSIALYRILKGLKSSVELLQMIKLEIAQSYICGETECISQKEAFIKEKAVGLLDCCESIKKHEKNKWVIKEIDEYIKVLKQIQI